MASEQPLYREAYPRLDIREIQAAVMLGRIVCTFIDEIGRELGQAFIVELSEESILLGYALGSPYFAFRQNVLVLPIEHRPDPVNRERFFFRCPKCSRYRKILFFKWDWLCAACHKLGYRSQLLHGDVRDYEYASTRRDELRQMLAKGRPHRVRHETYAQLCAELERLEKWLANNPRLVASAEHRYLITGRWMEPKDLPNQLTHPHFYVRGNAIEELPHHSHY